MSDAIPAATIILLRDEPRFETLMVARHANIAFAGGAMVFPGGRIDAGDHAPGWKDHCNGAEGVPEDQLAPRIAAIREAFEETGLLLARRGGRMIGAEAAALGSWRKRVEDNDALFLEMIKGEGLRLALDELHFFARWRPGSEVPHRRYDTWFFAARAPEAQIAEEDGGEATEVVWAPPSALLADRDAGRRKMIFPTSRNVELLNVSPSASEVFDFAARRRIDLIEPRIIERNGNMFLTIPDDMGYPVTEEILETAMRD
ncbi:NUDIX hydrolase [Hyphococcus sp.]|jgi:8-oxo-dGTP pyrophosphatase MutT (NUDIX family)|uniref:NUDIX hydrolase n=1 Tax=Hyphococcus sp. TaxID=2038636 RepID=UPI003D11AB96